MAAELTEDYDNAERTQVTVDGGVVIDMMQNFPPEVERPVPCPGPGYAGFRQYQETLPKGYRQHGTAAALETPILVDYNVAVPMRDGIKVYCDIRRPADQGEDEKIPAIIAWCGYGKQHRGFLQFFPLRMGMPEDATSSLEHAEGPDPGYFCHHRYAVVHFDTRGSWDSEGDLFQNGPLEGRDVHDACEWIAKQNWCNGSVGMSGNSWLAIAQWFGAAEQPPSLKAIAPWEGYTDTYRDHNMRGGINEYLFPRFVMRSIPGRGRKEDSSEMIRKGSLYDNYWKMKRVDFDRIVCPAYVVASYTSQWHVAGSIRGFRNIKSKNKWLRIHPYQEWIDITSRDNLEDLRFFYDRYLKGIQNDWEKTPQVRASLLRFNEKPIINHVFPSYPPPAAHKPLYLDSNGRLLAAPSSAESSLTYQSDDGTSTISFDYVFDQQTLLAGYAKLKIWISCPDFNDADIHCIVRKIDKDGQPLEHLTFRYTDHLNIEDIPRLNITRHLGMQGKLRMSHREIDPELSTPSEPFHPHTKRKFVTPGKIVDMEIGIWPMGTLYEAGEGIKVIIGGSDQYYPEIESNMKFLTLNRGSHNIHMGGQYDSHILLPFAQL